MLFTTFIVFSVTCHAVKQLSYRVPIPAGRGFMFRPSTHDLSKLFYYTSLILIICIFWDPWLNISENRRLDQHDSDKSTQLPADNYGLPNASFFFLILFCIKLWCMVLPNLHYSNTYAKSIPLVIEMKTITYNFYR